MDQLSPMDQMSPMDQVSAKDQVSSKDQVSALEDVLSALAVRLVAMSSPELEHLRAGLRMDVAVAIPPKIPHPSRDRY